MSAVEGIELERHPWPPYIPDGARVLIMGTFPPGRHRWSMDFYYPNRTNDFWFMMGLLFMGDRDALYDRKSRNFRLDDICRLLDSLGVALNDTGRVVQRLKGNASDKFLNIVEPVPLQKLLASMPLCRTVATTGEKAAAVVSELTATPLPRMGECVLSAAGLHIWRMPSTSRAYPMALETKASFYARLFRDCGIMPQPAK